MSLRDFYKQVGYNPTPKEEEWFKNWCNHSLWELMQEGKMKLELNQERERIK